MAKNNTPDLLIVGAGPAGLQCARSAVENGLTCLVIEKAKDFQENNFSSGAAPMDIMTEYRLPETIVEKKWSRFQIVAENKTHIWQSEKPVGVILGFAELREFLKEEARNGGASILFKTHFLSSETKGDKVVSKVKHGNESWEITSSLVIDATGGDRRVIDRKPSFFSIIGSEVWARVDPSRYGTYDDSLTFFLGPSWFPQGYGWVFPQKQEVLKVGVIRYFQGEDWVPHPINFSDELFKFTKSTVGDNAVVEARHGKGLTYYYKRSGPHVRGRILAVGDAAGTLNPLGCEGLRYALQSGELAAKSIDAFLKGDANALLSYEKKLAKIYNLRWRLTEWVAKKLYRDEDSRAYILALDLLAKLPLSRLMKLLFEYDPFEMVRFGIKYQWKRFWLPEEIT